MIIAGTIHRNNTGGFSVIHGSNCAIRAGYRSDAGGRRFGRCGGAGMYY